MTQLSAGANGRPTVGLVYPLQFKEAAAALHSFADVEVAAEPTPAGVAALMPGVEALIARGPTKIAAVHIESAPALRLIAVTGSGTDHIDVNAASRRGIPVTNGAGVAPYGVAEYVLGALIVGHRRLLSAHEHLLDGSLDWRDRANQFCPPGLGGATLGLVGLGSIAQAVADKVVAALGMNVLAYDPYVEPGPGIPLVSDLTELFDRSDAVSVHVPLAPETRGLIGRELLRRLGPSGILVNASRGGVVDVDAMIELLRSGELGGAWVDVFDREPPAPEQLVEFRNTPNLVVTPHLAGITVQVRRALELNSVDQVRRVLAGDAPTTAVNGQARSR
jgi:phosphoglycerate dehydrogenase-like enzyme